MNSTRILFILSMLMILSVVGQSQSTYRGCYGFDCKEKKWSLSFFAGYSLLGPGDDIKNGMEDSGFADTKPSHEGTSGPVGPVAYPIGKNGLIWNVEANYAFAKKSGIRLTVGKGNHTSTEGWDNIGAGNQLHINSDLWTASFNYVWRVSKEIGDFNVGPVIARFDVNAGDANSNRSNTSTSSKITGGFNLGYTVPLVQKESWFLSFKANYTWLPDTEIGPYTQQHELALADKTILYTSTYNKTNVQLSTIHFGLTVGCRF
jgi:hypothetical protein